MTNLPNFTHEGQPNKNVEDKLLELEVKLSVYKETLNKDQLTNKYKVDIIKSLRLSTYLLKANDELNIKTITSMKAQNRVKRS